MRRMLLALALLLPLTLSAQPGTIRPGEPWLDTAGDRIQAHGGGVTRIGDAWFWVGEDYANLAPGHHAVHLYRSQDLLHWTSLGRILDIPEPDDLRTRFGKAPWQLERPKLYVARHPRSPAERYVLYFHLDADYKAAEVGIAVSAHPEGPYRFVRHFRPLGQESRDIGQFVDDDGTNYLIFESRPTGGFFLARLSDDALSVAEQTFFFHQPFEGGAIAHLNGRYYVVGSHLTGWAPNPDLYATATSLRGPWSDFRDLAPPATNTYSSQSACLLKVTGTRRTSLLFLGDQWNEHHLEDSRYLWMPLTVDGDRLTLPPPAPWQLNPATGQTSLAQPAHEEGNTAR